jgi:hypothetical protein
MLDVRPESGALPGPDGSRRLRRVLVASLMWVGCMPRLIGRFREVRPSTLKAWAGTGPSSH